MSTVEAKKRIQAVLYELLAQDFVQENTAAYEKLTELQQDIKNDFFVVVVLGEFKRGKSTFINALIGNDLLPTDVLPETATINALIYNEKPELEIIMQDGSVECGQVERSFLERFSAKNQTDECSKIKYLKIGYPFKLLNNNVVIVDTPGVSDLNEQRCDVTYNFIPKANAVLFLLDANSPLKKSEIDFIEEKLLAQGIDNIIFLVNKYDNIDDEEDEDFWENLQVHMLKAFSESEHPLKALNMYPLSAKMALRGVLEQKQNFIDASGIMEIKTTLQKTVSEGRVEEEKLARYKGRMQTVLLGLGSELENKRALKSADLEKLREAQAGLQELFDEQLENKQKLAGFVEEEKKNIIAMTDKSLRFFYKRLEERIIDDVQFYKGLDFKDYVEQRVSKAIQRELENWLMSYAPNIDVLLRTVEKEIARGISYRFNQKIALNANFGNKPGVGGYGVNVTALDVSNATVKAGALTAGGAGLLMLIGGPVLMPFISMAAFPFLQRRFLEDQLATAKEQVIPSIQEQLSDCVFRMQQELHKYIDEKSTTIIKNSEYAYDTVLEDLRSRIDAEIDEKKHLSNDLGGEIAKLSAEINSINKTLQDITSITGGVLR